MSEGDFQRKDLVMRKKICRLYVQCIAIAGFHCEKFYIFHFLGGFSEKIFGNEKENLSSSFNLLKPQPPLKSLQVSIIVALSVSLEKVKTKTLEIKSALIKAY